MMSPALTRRLENVPSTGARTSVKSRSRSALASVVWRSASWARASVAAQGDFDIVARGIKGGLRRSFPAAAHRSRLASGAFKGGAGSEKPRRSALLLALRKSKVMRVYRAQRGGDELRLGLFDGAFLRGVPAADAIDRLPAGSRSSCAAASTAMR